MKASLFFILLLFLMSSCKTSQQSISSKEETELNKKAKMLAQQNIIVDGHIDLPYRLKVKNFRLEKEFIGIPVESDEGDFDFVRARNGGLDAPFMSIFIPASYQKNGGAKDLADSLITMIEYIANENPKNFMIAKTPQDVQKAFEAGKVALPMGMENGAGIEDDLTNIAYFDKRGISYITLTHSKDNLICDSSYDTTRTWNGLSDYGKSVVHEMNRVGIMVDISHVSDSAFYDVLEIVDLPVIASHSSARQFVPGFERNMSNEMITALGKNGGVIMVNFGSTFLDGNIRKERDQRREQLMALLEEAGVTSSSDEGKDIIANFEKMNPNIFSDVKKVADHIDLIVEMAGIDHVGFGSDYDGVGDSLPTGLKDVSDYPNLIEELLRRGYSEDDISKICYKNLFRVWNKVEKYAKNLN
ncbi:MAG: dipeptidase [Saprospiraceae bacterium]|nr:dipeptidase [Saprospiraceae bacterium]